jgi:hypothetical protein
MKRVREIVDPGQRKIVLPASLFSMIERRHTPDGRLGLAVDERRTEGKALREAVAREARRMEGPKGSA